MSLFSDSMSSEWRLVSEGHTATWDVSGVYDGYDCKRTVYMEFRDGPSELSYDQCEASILLDADSPYVRAYPVTVARGNVCRLEFWASDHIGLSPEFDLVADAAHTAKAEVLDGPGDGLRLWRLCAFPIRTEGAG